MINAEQSVLGSLLLDCEALDRVEGLRPEHFADHLHARVFAELLALSASGIKFDLVSVAARLENDSQIKLAGGFGYVAALAANSAGSANISHHAKLVRDAATNRELMAAAVRIHELALSPMSVAERVDAAQALIADVADQGGPRDTRLIRDVLLDHLTRMEGRWGKTDIGVPTGIAPLDAQLQGLRAGNLVIIAARPAMGKTALAMQIARVVAESQPVLFLSQEMSEGELTDRLLASIGKIPMDRIIHGGMDEDEDTRFGYAVSKLDGLKLFIDDQGGLTLADVQAKSRKVKRKHGLGLIVLDYLQLMAGDGDSRNATIETISRGLKALAKNIGCPIIALSQLSRKCEERTNKRPIMSDLRDSGAIEQDADVVLMLYREEEYDRESPAKGTAEVLIRKNRQGKTGDVRLVFVGEHMTFGEYTGGPINNVRPIKTHRGGFNYE